MPRRVRPGPSRRSLVGIGQSNLVRLDMDAQPFEVGELGKRIPADLEGAVGGSEGDLPDGNAWVHGS